MTENGSYVYTVRYIANGQTCYSDPIPFTKKNYQMVAPPSAPTDLAIRGGVTGGSARKALLTWKEPTTGGPVDHYAIYRTDNPEHDIAEIYAEYNYNITLVAEVPVGTTTYLDSDYYASSACYLVRAVNAAGDSTNTEWTVVNFEDNDWATEAPGAPVITKCEVTKVWDDSADAFADALHVEWLPGTGGDASQFTAMLDQASGSFSSSEWVDGGASAREWTSSASFLKRGDGTYRVKIVAENSKGSAESTIVSHAVGTADKPQVPRLDIANKSMSGNDAYQPSIKLLVSPSYSDPWAGTITQFNVYRSSSGGAGTYVKVGSVSYTDLALRNPANTDQAMYFDTTFDNGYATAYNDSQHGMYYYKVTAENAKGESPLTDAMQWRAYKTADQAASILAVENAIRALPTADSETAGEVTADNYTTVGAAARTARASYNALHECMQAAIRPALLTKLSTIEARVKGWEDSAEEVEAGQAVKTQIDNLDAAKPWTVDNLATVAPLAASARSAYDALTATGKAVVTNSTTLTDAETAIAALQVAKLVDDLPGSVTLDNAQAVRNAQIAYKGLSSAQKTYFDTMCSSQKAKLNSLGTSIDNLQAAVDDVVALLSALPEPSKVTSSDETQINNAAAAYNALSEVSQKYVNNALKIRLADDLAQLVALANQTAANSVILAIGALPDPADLVLDNKTAVENAETQYAALTDDQKDLVTNYSKLVSCRQRLDDLTAAAGASTKIAELSGYATWAFVDIDTAKTKVNTALNAYEALTAAAQALVSDADKSLLQAAQDKIAALEAALPIVTEIDSLTPVATISGYDTATDADKIVADQAAIAAARSHYNALSAAAKAEVGNYATLTAAENAIGAKLEAQDTDKDAANAVSQAIATLQASAAELSGASSLADLQAAQARAAAVRGQYDALTSAQKYWLSTLIGPNETDLATVETSLAGYVATANQTVANRVIDQITALKVGEVWSVDAFDAKVAAVADARAAFDVLTPAQQALVTNAGDLATADTKLSGLVNTLITNLGTPGVWTTAQLADGTPDKVANARAAYNKLTTQQRTSVDTANLAAAENRLSQLEMGAVQEKVDAIPANITGSDADQAAVGAAEVAYNALNDDQKALMAEAKATIDAKKQEVADRIAANTVEKQIGDLPKASVVTVDDKPAVQAARNALSRLTSAQRKYISSTAQRKLAGLESAISDLEISDAQAKVNDVPVPESINVDTLHDAKQKTEAARSSYDALSATQKKKVTSIARLTSAEERIASLADIGNASVTLSSTRMAWTGRALYPAVTVRVEGAVLPTDCYTLHYYNNTNVGTATVRVAGAGDYVGYKDAAFTIYSTAPVAPTTQTMYRLYNRWSGEHLFTLSKSEYDSLGKIGWKQEGEAWKSPTAGTKVYRLYNRFSGDHHYTTSADEYATLGRIGWTQEGVAFYSGGNRKVYRGFNPYETIGTHHYTTDANEIRGMVRNGWKDEGVGWYCY